MHEGERLVEVMLLMMNRVKSECCPLDCLLVHFHKDGDVEQQLIIEGLH